MNDVKEVIGKVRALLSEPRRWCRWSLARTAQGRHCSVHSNEAVSFCLLGAIERCCEQNRSLIEDITVHLNNILFSFHQHHHHDLVKWQDEPDRTFDEIQHLLEAAEAGLNQTKKTISPIPIPAGYLRAGEELMQKIQKQETNLNDARTKD